MSRCCSWALLFLLFLSSPLIAQQSAESNTPTTKSNENLPRVFLIGDSISLGYTGPVTKLLEGKAIVTRPATNCQHTAFGLQNLEKWLGDEDYDVIHFNWGIWDTHHLTKDTNKLVRKSKNIDPNNVHIRHTPEQYADNLRALIKILKSTGATLVWASTTPIWAEDTTGFKNIAKYNAVAAEVMKEEGITTNDLYTLVLPNRKEWQGGDTVHFNAVGNAELAKQVSASISQALEMPAGK